MNQRTCINKIPTSQSSQFSKSISSRILILRTSSHQLTSFQRPQHCNMKLSSLALFSSGAAAFVPPMRSPDLASLAIHAFIPNKSEFCYGLPGKVAPFSDGFDPFGFCARESYETIKTFRESEVTHGRVAMLAGKCAVFLECKTCGNCKHVTFPSCYISVNQLCQLLDFLLRSSQ